MVPLSSWKNSVVRYEKLETVPAAWQAWQGAASQLHYNSSLVCAVAQEYIHHDWTERNQIFCLVEECDSDTDSVPCLSDHDCHMSVTMA